MSDLNQPVQVDPANSTPAPVPSPSGQPAVSGAAVGQPTAETANSGAPVGAGAATVEGSQEISGVAPDYAKQIANLNSKLEKAIDGYGSLQAQLAERDKRIAELTETRTKDLLDSLPEGESWVKALSDPKGQFFPLMKKFIEQTVQQASRSEMANTASEGRVSPELVSDNLQRVNAMRDVAQYAATSGMEQNELLSLLVQNGLKVDSKTGQVTQLPFHWCDDATQVLATAKDIIRGRMAPRMAQRTIAASAEAGRAAADATIKGSLPAPGAVSAGTSGGSVEGQNEAFLSWLVAPADAS